MSLQPAHCRRHGSARPPERRRALLMACVKGEPSSHRACVERFGRLERRNDARGAMAAAVVGLVC